MNPIEKLLLIVNPISGDINKDDLIASIEQRVKNDGISLKIYKTSGNNDALEIQNLVKKFKPHNILIAGGDGTIKLAVESLKDEDLIFGLLPVGSANGLATSLNIPDDLKEALEIALNNTPRPVDLLKLNDEICIHISDIGMNAELIEGYENGSIRGKLGYALQAIPTIKNTNAPYEFSITTDSGDIKRSAIMIVMANAQMYGNGAMINPNGKIDDGKFELLVFKSLDIGKILQTLVDKAPMDDDFVEVICTAHAVIKSNEKVCFQIDGEYVGKLNEIKVSIYPKQLMICY